MTTLKRFSLLALAVSTLPVSTTAMAASTPEITAEKTKTVYYEDIDLATEQGQGALKTRIKSAARQVCANTRAITPKELMDRNLCEKRAIAKAMPKAEQTIAAYLEASRLAFNRKAIVGN